MVKLKLTSHLATGNRLVQTVIVEQSTRHKWVKGSTCLVDFCQVVQVRQCLSFPVRFPAPRVPSEKESALKGKICSLGSKFFPLPVESFFTNELKQFSQSCLPWRYVSFPWYTAWSGLLLSGYAGRIMFAWRYLYLDYGMHPKYSLGHLNSLLRLF